MARPTPLHRVVNDVTERIVARSRPTRAAYLDQLASARDAGRSRSALGCSNLAHAVAACGPGERAALSGDDATSIAIVTSYNDMLSAHAPYETYPATIKAAAALSRTASR